jgi:hypothetical protein
MNTENRTSFAEYLASIDPLTVGELRKAIEGLDDSTQVLIGSPINEDTERDWFKSEWFNVSKKIERPDVNDEYLALTLYISDNYDSRQF